MGFGPADVRSHSARPTTKSRSGDDILHGFPAVERAPDYVVMDVPYFGCVRDQYSDSPDDIANMDLAGWTSAWRRRTGLRIGRGELCTVIVANYASTETGDVVLCAEIVRDVWKAAGYELHRVAYASKHIQVGRKDARGTDRMP